MKHTVLRVLAAAGMLAASPMSSAQEAPARAVKLYDLYCVQCHGVNRDGNGVNSRDMSVKPRDHTDSKAMGDTSDEVLFKAIKEGGLAVSKSVLMPRWQGVMSDEEIKEMVGYLRIISKTGSK